MDVVAIRAAVAARLGELVGDDGTSRAYWEGPIFPPAFQVVGMPETEYRREGRPADDSEIELVVQAYSGGVSDRAAQDQLDHWKLRSGATSVRQILERVDDGKWLGLDDVFDVSVLRAGENLLFELEDVPGGPVVGCEFVVRIQTSG